MTNRRFPYVVVALSATVGLGLTSCGGDSASSGDRANTLKVVYQKTSTFTQLHDLMERTTEQFEAENPGMTVSLEPVPAVESEYFTKLALMNGSPSTAPDVIFEDTFQVRTDAAAEFLAPLDDCVADWEDWDQFSDAAKQAGKGDDGHIYGISMGTDTRGIFFNRNVFAAAGLPTDWQPQNWDDIIKAATAIRDSSEDGVIPIHINASKAQGEATSMQGFQMLLYGTGDTLFDEETSSWIIESDGMIESLTFLQTLTDENLITPLEQALDTNVGNTIDQKIRIDEVGMMLNGSWVPANWIAGENPWPEWEETIGFAKMPTSQGQAPGAVSMSGGWLLSMGAQAPHKEAACEFIKIALNEENSFFYDTEDSQIAVRTDVAGNPEYLAFNPSFEFFASLVPVTHFRPATPDYQGISDQLQIASESVITGQATSEQAAATFDEAVTRLVGEDMVTRSGSN